MRVRVLKGLCYGHRPDVEPEFDADPENPVIARGVKHGLLELVEEPEPEVEPEPEPEAPVKPATRRRKAN